MKADRETQIEVLDEIRWKPSGSATQIGLTQFGPVDKQHLNGWISALLK